MPETFTSRWSPRLLSVLRIMAAFVFIAHGTQKLFGLPGAGQAPPFHLVSWFGVAGVLETFGGSLLFLGLFTRPVAFCSRARWRWRISRCTRRPASGPFSITVNCPVLFCFLWLYISVTGGGPWSVDAWWHSRRTASA